MEKDKAEDFLKKIILDKTTKIYIAGHKGMVGSAVWKALVSKRYSNLIGNQVKEIDLTNQQAVFEFYKKEQPEIVINTAAKVGEYFSQ